MRVVRLHIRDSALGLDPALEGAVAAIGNFDGLHRGHQAVIACAAELARETGAPLAAISFEPHPREVIAPETAPARLTPMREKIRLLDQLGVDIFFVFAFNADLMAMPAAVFADDILIRDMGLAGIVCGPNFRFGHKRGGDPATLTGRFAAAHRTARMAEPFEVEGEICSSSRVREALDHGDVELAGRMLGRSYRIEGVVRTGDQRGRTIGFPTANVHPIAGGLARGRVALPDHGVYAVRTIDRGGVRRSGVANLGRRPTFNGRTTLLEVHIFDYEGDLYGTRLQVTFEHRIRAELKFEGIDALREQIGMDKETARRILAA
jgi:riboflavin kinase/FMN adenylyltransferase